MLRRIWRASGKRWLQQGQQWRERRRYPERFASLATAEQAGEQLEAALLRGTPFCAGRMGHVEARTLQERVLSLSFEVALLGCGAYGLPLAAAIRRHGRQAIHLGGALQLLFGIQGRRWDRDAQMQQLSNDRWIRPGARETPATADQIEGGCYW